MAVYEVGVAARRERVRRGRGHDGSGGTADCDQGEDDERRVEERASRPVGERAPRAAERRRRPARRGAAARPSRRGRDALTRGTRATTTPASIEASAGDERPPLGLARVAGGGDCEQRESGAEGEEGAADDPGLVGSRENAEDEQRGRARARRRSKRARRGRCGPSLAACLSSGGAAVGGAVMVDSSTPLLTSDSDV